MALCGNHVIKSLSHKVTVADTYAERAYTLLGNGLQQLYAIDRNQSDVVYSTGKGRVGAYAWS